MRRLSPRGLLAASVSLLAAACLVLVPHVRAARAATVELESYRTFGVARGVEFSFNFAGSIFEPLLHIGIPYARAGMKSQAGSTSDATAGQVYPGDLISSQAGDRFPGVATASYPPGAENVKDVIPFPEDGPVGARAGHVVADAGADHARSDVLTAGASIAPLISVGAVHVSSIGEHTDEGVVQTVRSVVNDVEVQIADGFSVVIGSVVSSARALSDGVEGDAEGHLTVSDAFVVLGGQEFPVTIDDRGIKVPDPLQEYLGVPLDIEQTVNTGLRQLGVSITTAGPTRIVDGSSAEGAVGGLIIGLTGEIPVVPVPQAFAQLIASVENSLPPEVTSPICFQEDIDPTFPLPLCIGRNILPGPGSGMVQTLSLGNVNALASATLAPDTGGDGDGDDDDNFGQGPDVGPLPGTPEPPTGPGPGGDGGPPDGGAPGVQLTGLLARMPPGVMLGLGLGLFVVAAGVSLLPMKRREDS